MTLRRTVSSCTTLAFAVTVGSWWACGASAMAQSQADGQGPLERRANPVTPKNPVPQRSVSVMPQNLRVYPPVIVELRVTVDERGRVGEVRPLGPGRETYTFYTSKPLGGEIQAFSPLLDPYVVKRPGADAAGVWPRPVDRQALVESAMEAVRPWLYDPPADGPIAFDVTFGLARGAAIVSTTRNGRLDSRCRSGRRHHR